MNNYKAVSIAEGFEDPFSHEEYIEAWQYLVDTGLAWKLQGYFGRTAHAMIEAGEIKYVPPRNNAPNLSDMGEARW